MELVGGAEWSWFVFSLLALFFEWVSGAGPAQRSAKRERAARGREKRKQRNEAKRSPNQQRMRASGG